MLADFHREYGIGGPDEPDAVLFLPWRYFLSRLFGLSDQSRFRGALAAEGEYITDQDEIQSILDRM